MTDRIAQWQLGESVGSGGNASVFRATHAPSGVPVAVKILGESRPTCTALRQFEREVRAVAGLCHPNIVRVFDHGRLAHGRPYLVMELAEATITGHAGRLPCPALFQVAMSVLDGLAHAHARGVLHRDVKPSNLLLPRGTLRRGGPPSAGR